MPHQSYSHNQISGFTLIELMIVLMVMALLFGLVGPLTMKSLDRAEAKKEQLTVKNWLVGVSHRAYYSGNQFKVALEGKQIQLANFDGQVIETFTMNSLFFTPTTVHFNRYGFTDKETVEVTVNGRSSSFNFADDINREYQGELNAGS